MYHGHKKLDILATKNDTIYVRRPVAVPKSYWYIVHSFCSFLPTTYQCDQIGRFFKVLGDKFSLKSSPNVLWMFGLLWKHPFSCINCCGYFLGNLVKFWATLYFSFWSHCYLSIAQTKLQPGCIYTIKMQKWNVCQKFHKNMILSSLDGRQC